MSQPTLAKDKARDPKMYQTEKGNQWYFGMKCHISVDGTVGLIHSLATSAANEHDLNMADELLHGEEKRALADTGTVVSRSGRGTSSAL